MIEWLQKYGGYTSTGLTIDEKKELESLRLQVKKYREMEESKEEDQETPKEDIQSESEDEDDVDPEIDNIVSKRNSNPIMKKMSCIPRSGVSAEVYGVFHKKENFVAKVVSKTQEQIQRIKTSVIHSFLFGNLDPKDLEVVINAMEEKVFEKGENIITQGEKGDCLYFVEEGKLYCYKKIASEQSPKLVKEYGPGDAFGELALLYNAPRAATITAESDKVITWVLDRETFNHIVKEAAQKKREKYENFLKKVEILSSIEPYELMQISDALKTATFKKGDYIIKEGEMGDVFYILEEGTCEATKTLEPGKPDTIIKEYSVGDYFGERALIKGEPRAANIIASSETVKVISLDRISFKRLLGPIEDILKRNIDKYQNFLS
jgi:cAMP-dependent protein kinase regulator